MTLDDAWAADRKGELRLAAVRYEEVLAGGEASLEVLLNLDVVYWQAAGTSHGLIWAKLSAATSAESFFEKIRPFSFPQCTSSRPARAGKQRQKHSNCFADAKMTGRRVPGTWPR